MRLNHSARARDMGGGDKAAQEEGVHRAVQRLLENLRRAYREPDQAKRPIGDPLIASWLRHSIAQRNVSEFLRNIGAEQDLADQFASISAAFYDLTTGRHPQLFKPHSPGGGRKRDPSDVWAGRTSVVMALICFIASGTADEHAAARLIAKIVDGDERYMPVLRLVRSGAAFESAILNWHKLLRKGKGASIGVPVFRSLASDLLSHVLAAGGAPAKSNTAIGQCNIYAERRITRAPSKRAKRNF